VEALKLNTVLAVSCNRKITANVEHMLQMTLSEAGDMRFAYIRLLRGTYC
jgi:hypothetical protein